MFNWTQHIADWVVYHLLGLSKGNHLAAAFNSFIFDTIKIFILLFFMTILMGAINSYFPIDKVRYALQKRKWYGLDYFLASFFTISISYFLYDCISNISRLTSSKVVSAIVLNLLLELCKILCLKKFKSIGIPNSVKLT